MRLTFDQWVGVSNPGEIPVRLINMEIGSALPLPSDNLRRFSTFFLNFKP